MKHLIRNALLTVLGVGVAGLVGCEWSGGGSDNSWNDSSTIANFNGTYQAGGGYLVSDYSSSSSSGGTTTTTTGGFIPPLEEINASFSGKSISFTTKFVPIKAGSVTVAFADGAKGSMTDNGSGVLSGSYLNTIPGGHPANGTVVYENGQVSLFFPDVLGLQASRVTIRYTVNSGTTSTSTTSGSGTAGSSGVSIYAFNVQQTGNKLKIIDNNGSVYEGSLGNIRTTGNVGSGSQGATFINGDQVSASFSASGNSAAGVHVNMTGTFQGTAAGVSQVSNKSGASVVYTTSMALANRRMIGTWIEDGGKTGNIDGTCSSAVNVSETSTVSTNSL